MKPIAAESGTLIIPKVWTHFCECMVTKKYHINWILSGKEYVIVSSRQCLIQTCQDFNTTSIIIILNQEGAGS